MTAVIVECLQRSYGSVRAVDGLSLTAAAGEVTALLGPNGAGKTTTVEICQGVRQRDGGAVQVLGQDPGTRSGHRELTSRVGVMPQHSGAWPGIRCRELLALIASFYAHPLDVDELLERLGLTSSRGTAVRRMSGGQQQRLSLATAVVGRPELVFLDEPSAGLDVQARITTWDLIRELRQASVTVVLTTHDMAEAADLADQVVVIDAGRVLAAGTVAELTGAGTEIRFRSPTSLDLASLQTALPAGCSVSCSGDSYVVVGRADPDSIAAITAFAAAQGVLLTDLRSGGRSLQDVFLDLTGHELRA